MFEIGICLFLIGIAIMFIGIVIDYTAADCFVPPALICLIVSIFLIAFGTAVSNETISNTCTTQAIETNQEISDTNHYNYCPNCGYDFCETKEN